MLSLLAVLLLGQVEPPPDPRPSTPAPTRQADDLRDIDLKSFTQLVSKVARKEFVVPLTVQFERSRVMNVLAGDAPSPERLFGVYQRALASNGYGLVRDSSMPDLYHIVQIGQTISVVLPHYEDVARLPDGYEICSLRIPLRHLAAQAVFSKFLGRLNPRFASLVTTAPESLTLVEFAPTLKSLAAQIEAYDEEAGRSLTPVDLSWWLVELKAEGSPGVPDSLREFEALLKERAGASGRVALAEKGSIRCTPTEPDRPAKAAVTLRATYPELAVDLAARLDRGAVRLDDFRVWRPESKRDPGSSTETTVERTLYRIDKLSLTPGEATVAWMSEGRLLIVKASVGKAR